MKKISFIAAFIALLAGFLVSASPALAATPVLSLVNNGDGDTVQVNVTGDANANILMFYTKTNFGGQVASLGTTSSGGLFSTNISTSGYGIAAGSSVYVETGGLNGSQSAPVAWPTVSTNGGFSVSPTGVVLSVGQSSTITATNNGSQAIYLSNNTNPPVANININSNQLTIIALANGSTVATFCLEAAGTTTTQGTAATCASVYITVQNSGAQSLTFSMSNVSVSPGQSVPVTISGGNGIYSVLNNSNSSVVQASISGSTMTLSTNSTSGSASVTVCSSDMVTCGIVNATVSSASTLPLTFSPANPTISLGQVLNVNISGGPSSPTFYVVSNSNQAVATTTISGFNLQLTGSNYGTTNITVCSYGGGCGNLTATVNYVSYGGPVVLSQSVISLLVGQVVNVTVSGGATPYTLTAGQSNIFQSSLNGNIITLSGIGAGSSTLTVCPAGGACATLSVTVSASGAGTPITFSQNNLNLSVGSLTALTISGGGGYYVSTSANPNVASVQVSGSTALITPLAAGSNNISICQSGGQCAILFVNVTAGASTVPVPTFSQTNPIISGGQVVDITVSGGTTSNYYILANTNPSVLQLSLNAGQLALTGLTSGSSTVAICAAANSCGVLTVSVSGTASSAVYFNTNSLSAGTVGQAYSSQISVAGGSGSGYTFSLTSGTLPDGLTLSNTGLLSGTPTAAAINSISVKATDSSGNSASSNFTLTINAALAAPAAATAPAGASGYPNGELINEGGTVYIVYQNTKVAFANAPAFLGLGFSFSNVTAVTNSGLTLSPKIVVTAAGSHPRGTWVLNGQAVYFVTPAGLIPVADWNTFLNNGGQASFIVKANSYDLAMHKLSVMVNSDARLQP